MTAPLLWHRLRDQLRRDLDPEEFSTWIQPLKVAAEDEDRVELVAPSERFLHTLEQSYRPAVDRAISRLDAPGFEVLFSVAESSGDSRPDARPSASFNPRYTFSSFVVGNSNQFAHAAARSIADRPADSYNPFFLYGGVGLGKTHLLHAIGHQLRERNPHLQVVYLPAEHFVNELIGSLRFNRMPEFRERYRSIDVFMVDDIQFLANKERTQEEFFHTFNCALRGPEADHPLLGLLAAPSPEEPRGAAAQPLRVGADRRHPAARPRDEGRDPAPQGRSRRHVELPDDVALFIANQVQVQHARARGDAQSGHRLRLADRPAAHPRPDQGDPQGHSSRRGSPDSAVRGDQDSWPGTTA